MTSDEKMGGMADQAERATPPIPARSSQVRRMHGDEFVDQYEWLRKKESPQVQEYVAGQNAYANHRLAGLKPLAATLFQELKDHVQEDDMSVPVRLYGYWYFSRTQEGKEYGTSCRVPVRSTDDWDPPVIQPGDTTPLPGEEVVFDANKEAEGQDFFRSGGIDLSDDGRWMIYLVDTTGDERYTCRMRDLTTGRQLDDVLEGISANACLTPDGAWIFYTRVDEAWRPCSIWRHKVGTPASDDVEVYHEGDERFWCSVGLSFDESLIVIETGSKTTNEVLFLDVENPEGAFMPFISRKDEVEYDVAFAKFENVRGILASKGREDLVSVVSTDQEGNIPVAVVTHNVNTPNFEVDLINMASTPAPYRLGDGVCIARGSDYGCEKASDDHRRLPVTTPWNDPVNPEILQGGVGLSVGGIGIYKDFVDFSYREGGLLHIAVETKEEALMDYLLARPWNLTELKGEDPQAVYSIGFGGNPSYEAPAVRYSLSSYTHPGQLRSYNPATGEDKLLKEATVRNYRQEDYAERRIWVKARDGQLIPVALIWKKGLVPAMDRACGSDGRPLACGRTDSVIEAPNLDQAARAAAAVWRKEGKTSTDLVPKNEVPEVLEISEVSEGSGASELPEDGSSPCLITAYGSYGSSSDPAFGIARLGFLDRGVLRVEAQVRGGGELGRAWYEQGRRLKKVNTFNDFVDVTAALQSQGWISPATTVANGGSAGGLLMGAVANQAPFLYSGIEADVPFVDALNSILDPSLPLTVTEWDEWGDPLHDPQVYRYMKAYTPYENVMTAQERRAAFGTDHFPQIYITTSMNDTRVLYVEPLKWLSRLQEPEVGADAFASIEVVAGHGGVSGRYKVWEEVSRENSWCLSRMGIEK
ncbi:S9 family peptidase [Parascardovia denticolens]|uniref:S9 family peptidase n=1 Tax=Parascardovia denticolens TaxID=78258 RepID=UPI00248D612A|nr:prolyl oligopeptidase family serine peptidase [Parascardovia denticolens]